MDNNKLVSVIVPVYNVEDYVKECLESIIAQTYQNIEIIVVNDGSTDRSFQICKEINDRRIVLIDKENGGLSDARNKGVEISSGEYIIFVDSDDVVHPQLIEELLGNLLTYNGDIAGCNFVKFDDGQPIQWEFHDFNIQRWTTEEVMGKLVGECSNELTVAVCKLYHRNIIVATPFPLGKIHEDEFVAYKILSSCNRFIYSGKKLYGYRQRKNSIMSTYSVKAERDKIEAKQNIFDFYKNNICNPRSKARAFFLMMRNIELSYFKIYRINKNEVYLQKLVILFQDLYRENNSILRFLNLYERFILGLFYKSKFLYRFIEWMKKGYVQ